MQAERINTFCAYIYIYTLTFISLLIAQNTHTSSLFKLRFSEGKRGERTARVHPKSRYTLFEDVHLWECVKKRCGVDMHVHPSSPSGGGEPANNTHRSERGAKGVGKNEGGKEPGEEP